MNATLDHPDAPRVLDLCLCDDKSQTPVPQTPPRPKFPGGTEIVRHALEVGIPLHVVEDYLDWCDMCRRQ